MEVDPPSALPVVSGPWRSCGVRLAGVALRFAYPTSRRRRGTPSGSVTRFTPLPAVRLVAPTRAVARYRIVTEQGQGRFTRRTTPLALPLIKALMDAINLYQDIFGSGLHFQIG